VAKPPRPSSARSSQPIPPICRWNRGAAAGAAPEGGGVRSDPEPRLAQGEAGHGFVVDARWVLQALAADALVAPDEARLLEQGIPRSEPAARLHPLEWVAQQEPADARDPERRLGLDELSAWLAEKAGLPFRRIDPLKVNVPAVTAVMAYGFAERQDLLALEVRPTEVVIATTQPFFHEWEDGLRQTLAGKAIHRVVVNPADARRYRIQFYNLARSVSGALGQKSGHAAGTGSFEQLLELGNLQAPDANDQHIVSVVDWLLQYAFDQRASDIHMEPRREAGRVRFRIDGVLHEVYELPPAVMAAAVSRIKILGRMDVAEKRRPQDGRLKTKSPDGEEVELRLSTLPTAFGEKLVMRIFDPDVLMRSYEELGLAAEELQAWRALTSQPQGMLLVTGPTGSGKTTTLYSTLRQLSRPEVNVCTVEDPIEMIEPSFNQMQVQPAIGVDFAAGVRALLRQDPDIIMVGEIRDRETAEVAIQAALTGHLVLSTLHTNDAPSAVTRLLDIGVPPYLITSTVLAVMAQRLVRTLCPHCRVPGEVEEDVWRALVHPWKAERPRQVFAPGGCLECRNTGYLGRVGIHELMPLTPALKPHIQRECDLASLRTRAWRDGVKTLRLAGARKVAAGQTTPAEVIRVAPPAGED
jgi:general secretion pathway protein E